jgi:cytochrome c553
MIACSPTKAISMGPEARVVIIPGRSSARVCREVAVAALLLALAQDAGASLAPVESPTPAGSVAPDPQYGRVLYLRHCAACHGPRAWGDGPREIPALAGQREDYIIEQLTHFASGDRPGSEMHGPAMRDTLRAPDVNRAPAIRDLAAYLAHTPPVPQSDQGEGRSLAAGKSLYIRECAACHGEQGSGGGVGSMPRIGGQHFRYVLSRLREFAAVHRGLDAAAAGSAFSAEQQQAVSDYVSRLPGSGSVPQGLPQ